MKRDLGDNFDKTKKYRLYRNVYEIIHPTISKKNISNYKIVLQDNLLPIQVFYPDKISNMNSLIIFIPGDGKITGCKNNYSSVCQEISKKCNKLVISLDYSVENNHFPTTLSLCYETIKYLSGELEKNNIPKEKVYLMGDSTGANLIAAISIKARQENLLLFKKEILLYPILSGEYLEKTNYDSILQNSVLERSTVKKLKTFIKNYTSSAKDLDNEMVCPIKNKNYRDLPTTLIITGDLDPLRGEGFDYYEKLYKENKKTKYKNILFAPHGFLSSKDEEIKTEMYNEIIKFIS